jgi:hypothetical protein
MVEGTKSSRMKRKSRAVPRGGELNLNLVSFLGFKRLIWERLPSYDHGLCNQDRHSKVFAFLIMICIFVLNSAVCVAFLNRENEEATEDGYHSPKTF